MRFAAALEPLPGPIPLPLFGAIRSRVLRSVRLQEALPDSDLAVLAEISLHGRFLEIAEPLFYQREHADRIGNRLSRHPHLAAGVWKGDEGESTPFPHWRLAARHLDSVRRARLPVLAAAKCTGAVAAWAWCCRRRRRERLLRDIALSGAESAPFARTLRQIDSAILGHQWRGRTRQLRRAIEAVVPDGATAIVADGGEVGLQVPGTRKVYPFTERDGQYWGPPANGTEAVDELERLRAKGATHLLVAWPVFWWLDYYCEMSDYLARHARPLVDNAAVKAFKFDAGSRTPLTPRQPDEKRD